MSGYEAAPGDVGRVLLLYSGGLDTTVMLQVDPGRVRRRGGRAVA